MERECGPARSAVIMTLAVVLLPPEMGTRQVRPSENEPPVVFWNHAAYNTAFGESSDLLPNITGIVVFAKTVFLESGSRHCPRLRDAAHACA